MVSKSNGDFYSIVTDEFQKKSLVKPKEYCKMPGSWTKIDPLLKVRGSATSKKTKNASA